MNRPRAGRAPLFCLLLVSCGPCRGEGETKKETLVLGTLFEPTTLDPAFARSSGEQEVVRLLFRDLTTRDDHWEIQPDLAVSLPNTRTATDGTMRVTWTLRDGYAWSDGRPVTTEDVVFGHRIEADDRLAAANHEAAKKVQAIRPDGAHRFEVIWSQPFADYRTPRIHGVLPAHAYPAPDGPTFAGMIRNPVSNGPFRLVEWVPGRHLITERSDGWGGRRAALDRIVFRFFQSEDGLVAALKAGEIDAAGEASGLGPDAADVLKAELGETHAVELRRSGAWLHLEVRLDHPVLADVRVRRAISLGTDRTALAKIVYGGYGVPAYGIFPQDHPGHLPDPARGFDPEEARRLLAEAGKAGATIDLMYAGSTAARAATYLVSALGEVGLKVAPKGVHFRVLRDKLDQGTQSPLVLFLWRTTPGWDGRSVLHSTGAQNHSGYRDAEVDRWLDEAERSMTAKTWGDRVRRVNERFMADLPVIPLLFRQTISVRPRDLEGWAPTGARSPVTWNAEHWRKTPSMQGPE